MNTMNKTWKVIKAKTKERAEELAKPFLSGGYKTSGKVRKEHGNFYQVLFTLAK